MANKSTGCFNKMCSLGKLSYLNMFSFKLRRKTTNETSLLLKLEAEQIRNLRKLILCTFDSQNCRVF